MYRISDIDTAHISHTDTHMHIIHTQHTSHTCAHMRTHLSAPEGLMWSLLPPGPHGNSSGAARLGGLGGVMGDFLCLAVSLPCAFSSVCRQPRLPDSHHGNRSLFPSCIYKCFLASVSPDQHPARPQALRLPLWVVSRP